MPRAAAVCSVRRLAYILLLLLVVGLSFAPESTGATNAGHLSRRAPRPRTWSYFGINSFHFVGSWLTHHYQATVFLRVVCLNHTSNTVRMVVSMYDAPLVRTSGNSAAHSDTPAWYLHSSSNSSVRLPRVWFRGRNNVSVEVIARDWEHHAEKMTTAELIADTQLPNSVPFVFGMQGSERIYHVPQTCSTKQHHLFKHNSAWLGVVTSETAFATSEQTYQQPDARQALLPPTQDTTSSAKINTNSRSSRGTTATAARGSAAPHGVAPSDAKQFLVHQHLQHHRLLGFAGSIMVVMQHTAEALMRSRETRQAVSSRALVLVLWDMGLEPRASHFMQIPANNLLRLAAWGSTTTLAFLDLDEFMVLPNHQTIQQELESGCLQGALTNSPEAILPSVWASSAVWKTGPELQGWTSTGQWSDAISGMQYVTWPYKYCSGVCQALVNPNSDMLFQVHGHHAGPHETMNSAQVPHSCAYLLHFYRLWSMRTPELMTKMDAGNTPGVPLKLQDLPPSPPLH